ncbi:U2 small nuclear ribonucleoprotein A' [Nakaseomyces bracarensis]|uniref:U2 small nuclear ribonucleoprotein A' n=1 Tax=Nakaseomyces bracarensis TaxID=273131 RepID=A0ABR4NLX8_9SACH
MKFSPGLVLDAPSYYVDHRDGRHNTQKCLLLRNLNLECDDIAMPSSLKYLPRPVHILDLTNNNLTFFPDLCKRVDIDTLLISKNQLQLLDGQLLPSKLQSLVVAYNGIDNFDMIQGLMKSPRTLKELVMIGNPICHLANYRTRVLSLLPNLEVLDFNNVQKEEHKKAFDEHRLLAMQAKSIDTKTVVATSAPSNKGVVDKPRDKTVETMNTIIEKMDPEKRTKIKELLANADSLEDIERVERMLAGGD